MRSAARRNSSIWTAHEAYIKKNRAALVDMFEDAIRVDALADRSEESRRRRRDRGEDRQAAAGAAAIRLLEDRSLSRSEHAAEQSSICSARSMRRPRSGCSRRSSMSRPSPISAWSRKRRRASSNGAGGVSRNDGVSSRGARRADASCCADTVGAARCRRGRAYVARHSRHHHRLHHALHRRR